MHSLQFVIGMSLTWFGIGALVVAIAWGREKHAEAKRVVQMVREVFSEKGIGHVVDIHPFGSPSQKMVHAHCICGETSLVYKTDDPTGNRLMEQWAENHIDTVSESAGR